MATPVIVAVRTANQARRVLEVSGAVLLWIAIGIVFHPSVNAYLLLGIPLTAAFQWSVRQEPLQTVWVRDGVRFRLGLTGWAMAAALAAYPGYRLVRNLRETVYDGETLWYVAAVAGAFAAAYALKHFHRANLQDLLYCLATAGVFGISLILLNAVVMGPSHSTLMGRLTVGVTSLLLYVPVTFVLEEVSFRGAFDAHVFHPGEPYQYLTAFFVSCLWGLWHIPVVIAAGQKPLPMIVIGLLGAHCAVGVPLSLYWRRSGNLFVTCATHAFVDAVRNALFVTS